MSLPAAQSTEPIPGYRLGQRLGAGGYGEVWTADAPGGLVKAIKFVYGRLDEDRAAREMKALNRIKGVRHPFLLSLERIEVLDGQLLIVTELADGSLKDRFELARKDGHSGIQREELLEHLRDAADALDYMNEQHSLQHLDVKPENLLLVGGRIKVADFGLVKDLHDVTASMMGGLTPIYAPPEVFEGRPSRRSDQYSLAIVYQEMLTGMLPFPGRTAAQLAAQHLNTRPRLTPLPATDQAVVARALSKQPDERFPSCRALADALLQAGRSVQVPAVAPPTGWPASQPSLHAADGSGGEVTRTLVRPRPHESGDSDSSHAATEGLRTPEKMLGELHSAVAATEAALSEAGGSGNCLEHPIAADAPDLSSPMMWESAELEPPPPLVDLPPLAVDAATNANSLRPTLILGIGGAAGRTLQKLRRRLDDRFSGEERSLFSLLLLDSDQQDLLRATHGEDGAALAPGETLHLPLRKTQDYRNDSRKILEWLSRRWLYNIPRSLQTEGMRPLGRLALVDHAERVHARLKEAAQALQQGLAAQRAKVGAAAPITPRVVVLSSISGGAGSGMVLDIVYAVRQVLDACQLSQAEVTAVFLHGTNRSPAQQELASVNARALLGELNHLLRPGSSFPGDPACLLSPRPSHAATLDAAYLLHVGEEMGPTDFDAASDSAAEFLLLAAATAATPLLSACRQEAEGSHSSQRSEVKLHSIGLRQIGFAHDPLIDAAVERTCHATIQRWLGAPREQAPPAKELLFTSIGSDSPPSPRELVSHDGRAAAFAGQLGLEVDALVQQVYVRAIQVMEGDADALFQRIISAASGKGTVEGAVQHCLAAAAELFGRRSIEPDAPPPPPSALQLAVEDKSRDMVAQLGGELRNWILAQSEDPHARIAGAVLCAKWHIGHLKSLGEKLRGMKQRLAAEASHVERQLLPDPRQKGRKAANSELFAAFLQFCRLRLFELSAQVAGQVCQALQSHASSAADAVQETARDLKQLAQQHWNQAQAAASRPAVANDDALAPLRTRVIEHLQSGEDSLAAQIDAQFTATLFASSGGLRAILGGGAEAREQFQKQLKAQVRQGVLQQLQAIDLTAMLLGENPDSPARPTLLRQCLEAIQPRLQVCGGQRRLLCILPRQAAASADAQTLARQLGSDVFQQLPTLVLDDSSDVVLLFEVSGISLHQAASAIIDHRSDLADVASRVHTRCDIPWQPLLLRNA